MIKPEYKLEALKTLNQKLKPPGELGGVFLPEGAKEQFDFMFIGEMPSMNEPKNWDGISNYNFNVTKRDKFLQEMMVKYAVGGSYLTDIVKARDVARMPTKDEIKKWLPYLLREIDILETRAIVVLGERTYKKSFKKYVEPFISQNIKVDYVFHYCSQVTRDKFEKRFSEIIERLKIQ